MAPKSGRVSGLTGFEKPCAPRASPATAEREAMASHFELECGEFIQHQTGVGGGRRGAREEDEGDSRLLIDSVTGKTKWWGGEAWLAVGEERQACMAVRWIGHRHFYKYNSYSSHESRSFTSHTRSCGHPLRKARNRRSKNSTAGLDRRTRATRACDAG